MNGGYSQNARVLKGAFADLLPPPEPTLRQLAIHALNAQALAAQASQSGREYYAEEVRAIAAQEHFWEALEAQAGLSRDMVEGLL